MKLSMRELRKSKKLTQQQVADAIGATKRQVGAWERGENDLPMDYAFEIADLLDCTVDDIAGRESTVSYYAIDLNKVECDELCELYRSMTDEGQHQLLVYARGLAATYPKNQVDDASGIA